MLMDRDNADAFTVLTRILALHQENAAADTYSWKNEQGHHSPCP